MNDTQRRMGAWYIYSEPVSDDNGCIQKTKNKNKTNKKQKTKKKNTVQ